MTIKEAIKKLTKEQIASAEEWFVVGTGIVFFSEQFDQPIYVTTKGARGLNGNSREDRAIIRAAQKEQKAGDHSGQK